MIEENSIVYGDAKEVCKDIPSDSIDLIFTSPPYADLRDYARIPPDNYVDWFLSFAEQFYRVLTPSGSFILNINDRIVKGERHLYVFDLVSSLIRNIGFKYYERFVWIKSPSMPWGAVRRFTDAFEYIFWFYKDTYYVDIDAVRTSYSPATIQRYKSAYKKDKAGFRKDGEFLKANPKGAKPTNVIQMSIAQARDVIHSAQFPMGLPEFFIKAATKEGQMVLDPFVGSGTTCIVAKKLKRQYIGIDIIEEYCKEAENRLGGV